MGLPITSFLTALILTAMITLSMAETYDCTIEKDGEHEVCVFHNVKYFKNTTRIAFSSPGSTKPERFRFVDCQMVAIPQNFLTIYGDDLKVLEVENCMLETVTITKNMEALHARNNTIEKVLMYRNNQCDNLKTLDLSSNRLESVNNITNCEKLETLNLSENENLWQESTLDLSLFDRLTQLQDLNLAATGILYTDNSKKTGLPLLKTIDLSKNDILPVDFKLEIFNPFTALETLKLNDNSMGSIDYAHLVDIKPLKTVYLNGNSFQCMKIKDMLVFLEKHGIQTPLDRHSNCEQNYREVEGMCCTGPMPTSRPRPPTASPVEKPDGTGIPLIENTTQAPELDGRNGSEGGGSHHWIIGTVVVILIVGAAGAGGYWYKRRHHH